MTPTEVTKTVVERFREAVGTNAFVDITDAASLYKVAPARILDAIVLLKIEGYRRFLMPYGDTDNVIFRYILSPPGTKFLDIYSNRDAVVMLEVNKEKTDE